MLNRLVRWSRIKSPWILHLNSGACNASDVIICTGPVTRQIKDRILRIYEQVPDPKFVVAVGACALSGCVYRGAYNIMGGIDQVIPVDAYVPGCPARPDAILDGVVKLLGKL